VTCLAVAAPTKHPLLEQCLVHCQTASVSAVTGLQPEKILGHLSRGFALTLPPLWSNSFLYLKTKTGRNPVL